MTPETRKKIEDQADQIVADTIKKVRGTGIPFSEIRDSDFVLAGAEAMEKLKDEEIKRLREALDVALDLANTPEQHQDERWCERREWCESVSREFEGGE